MDPIPFLTEPARSRLDLDGSGQISARPRQIRPDFSPNDKTRHPTWVNPKSTRPKPKNRTRCPGRFRVKFLSTRLIRVESGLGTNPTRPDLWIALATVANPHCPNLNANPRSASCWFCGTSFNSDVLDFIIIIDMLRCWYCMYSWFSSKLVDLPYVDGSVFWERKECLICFGFCFW